VWVYGKHYDPVSHQVYGTCQFQGTEYGCLDLHSELGVLMDSVQVVKEIRQLTWTMDPDEKYAIHIAK
jgi:hypothetical protein